MSDRAWVRDQLRRLAATLGGGPPSGPASGDLGGTYPSPAVTQARGIRETAGPTTLVAGAVADGEYLRRSGATVVGSAAARWAAQHVRTGVDSWYAAGAIATTAAVGYVTSAGVLRAYPIVCPRDGTISGLGARQTAGGVAGNLAIMGVYSALTDGTLYPNALLAVQSAAMNCTANGWKEANFAAALATDQTKLYWVVHVASASMTWSGPDDPGWVPILGEPSTTTVRPGVGWYVARAWDGTLPAAFPAGATQQGAGAGLAMPGLRYRWAT